MSIEFFLYLVELVGKLSELCTILFVVSMVFGILWLVIWVLFLVGAEGHDEERELIFYWHKIIFLSVFVLFWLFLLIPSQKTIYMMVGSSYLKNSEVPPKVHDLINKKLDEFLKGNK